MLKAEVPDLDEFKASTKWRQAFKRRNNLSTRKKTGKHGKTPLDSSDIAEQFRRSIIRHRHDFDYPLSKIINTDQSPICIDGMRNVTLNTKGEVEVLIAGTNNERSNFTVQLTVAADGTKFPPL